MHLKSLTVRGFKSFASATTFEFEPGVTAVVGPNGSGKSNVVDALAWVMGEQGAKTLRGGKMEDVIFAGTSGRAPLGRAHVSLTIDNADGALPIDYSEVTISRTLFRSGGSEYAINGESCRLLDIQELLSDSGLGREMHVIVGQGQLDRVLHATAEDRRGFVEEAAGILKHRRRKEKTVRKLEAMQANLARLQDLTGELRRQLTPLGRQAEVARRAQGIQFDVRDARARLLADDLVTLRTALEQEVADEQALKQRQEEVGRALEGARHRLASLELEAARAVPAGNAARDTYYGLGSVRERYRSLAALAAERARLLGTADQQPADGARDPDRLEEQAERLGSELRQARDDAARRAEALAAAESARAAAEVAAAEEDKALTALLRAVADRREGLARLAGQVGAARSRAEAAEGELGRLRTAREEAAARSRSAQEEYTLLEQQAAGVEEGEEGLDQAYEDAAGRLDAAEAGLERLNRLDAEQQAARGALAARLEALRQSLHRRDASRDLEGAEGVLGRVAESLGVEKGWEAAVAAALGPLAEGLAVAGLGRAAELLATLKQDDAGRASLLVAPAGEGTGPGMDPGAGEAPADAATATGGAVGTPPGPPAPGRGAAGLVEAPASYGNAVRRLLGRTAFVETSADAVAVLAADPGWTAVTRDGDVYTAASAAGGTPNAPSTIEQQAAIDETEARLGEVERDAERLRFEKARAAAARDAAAEAADAALERLHESDARISAVAERLGRLGSELRQSTAEQERLAGQAAAAEEQLARELAALKEAGERLDAANNAPAEADPSSGRRDALMAGAATARSAELEARLALRAAQEQEKALGGRIESLRRAAATERAAREAARRRAERRERQAAAARAVEDGAARVGAWLEASLRGAAAARDAADEERRSIEEQLASARAESAELTAELARLTDSVHRDELARTQQRLRIEALENRAVEELGLTADHLVAGYGPDVPVPVPEEGADKWAALRQEVDDEGRPVAAGVPFDRAEQEKRLRKAERELASLGKVNPLALEEFAALEERHKFLSGQLEDLKSSRKDLLDIIRDVDERVEQVFTEAFADTAVQFERVFARLFPGGEGRLVLTDPEDMLNTGIEVEARPAGKKIKRLSLLSGGERSLTAVALLVAIFKARPSPFYVMDEVEAALDDTNLGRLITIFEELRESSQLIVITHQKRTMQVADALYGVSMRGDGVSMVISQRLERSG
ncbi:chromosome segregation protein SMC [Zafaria sp. Z1313]|uniref:chromosome segregation protein SMC n=1 Tax=Zafaria sp. Z1313 TaxID=3423202 RepID=UPI003D30322B